MKNAYSAIRDETGSISVLTVILMAVFMGLLAYVIDLGHLHTVQNELRNAADACALRGARAFLPDTLPVSGGTPLRIDPDPDRAKAQASLTIMDNRSDDNKSNSVALQDLPIGEMDVGIWYYKPSECPGSDQLVISSGTGWWPPPASEWGKYIGPGIRLPVKRDDSHNSGRVRMTLAQLFGKTEISAGVSVRVKATAALSGVGGFIPGSPTLPFGPMVQYLPDPENVTLPYDYHGTFRGDNSDTIGWTNLDPAGTNPSARELRDIMTHGALYDCPYGSAIGVQNGVDASVIGNAKGAMTANGNRFGLIDPDGNGVFEPSGATNPASGVSYAATVYMMPIFETIGDPDKFNQSAMVGAVPVQIVRVAPAPDNYIDVRIVEGDWVVPGYGGGAWYGILATEPKLVQ